VAGVRGEATVQQVVESVMAAEQTVQAGVAIRDKVVSAYLEISRMSI
jgi:flagellar hook-basal body complex protein FliE